MTAQYTVESELALQDVKDNVNNFHHYVLGYLLLCTIIITCLFNSSANRITIPIVDLEFPTKVFYSFAPLALAFLHIIMLSKLERLACKMHNFHEAISDPNAQTEHKRLSRFLPGAMIAQWLAGNYLMSGKFIFEWFSVFFLCMVFLATAPFLYYCLYTSSHNTLSMYFVLLPAICTMAYSIYITCQVHRKHKQTIQTRNRHRQPHSQLKVRWLGTKIMQVVICLSLSVFLLFKSLGFADQVLVKQCYLCHIWPELNDKQKKDLTDLHKW